MKKFLLLLIFISPLGIGGFLFAQNTDTRYYEMRTYYCNHGKLNTLVERFTNHTTKLFEKHGMTNVGYWIPVGNDSTLVYLISFPNKDAHDASWKAFISDPEWQEVAKKSEENGKIISKIVSTILKPTDFSPEIKSSISTPNRSFEMRTYTEFAGKVPDILARFRDHTTKLFTNHGMENIMYFTTIEKDATIQPKLVYIIAHKSQDVAKKSWDEFRADPNWVKVRDESEKNGKIVEKVESVFMNPTAFSTIK
jgi:NIPSNAP